MNLISVFTTICSQLQGSPEFSYMNKFEHNANDHLDYRNGRVNLLEVEQPGFKFKNGHIRDRFPVFIEFIKKSDCGLTAVQRDLIVQEMKGLAAQFIHKIDESDLFEDLQEIIPGVEIVDRYDTNTAGIEINLVLVSQQPMSVCVE